MSDPQQPHELQPTRLLRPWDFPGKSTGVGCYCAGDAGGRAPGSEESPGDTEAAKSLILVKYLIGIISCC